MIHYTDNSYIANLYAPDMRVPISHVLGYPKRLENNCKLIDFSQLNFFEPDHETFPALSLAYRSLKEGKGIIFNAANEGAVNKFIRGEIGFLDIASHIEKALDQFDTPQLNNLDDIESFNNMVLNF